MAGVLDAGLHVGRESTYGTPVAPTRSFEAKADGHKHKVSHLESNGLRTSSQGLRSDRRVAINMGAEGSIELDVQNKGLGLLLQAMFGTTAGPTQIASTTAYTSTHQTDADGPTGDSLTVQLSRPMGASFGTNQPFTYHGGKVKSWSFNQALDAFLALTLEMDYEDSDTSTALATPTYPASSTPFHWGQLAVTVDGSAVDVKDFTVSGDNNLETERRFLRGSVLKKEPLRKGAPTVDGSMSAEFESLTHYNRFTAGTVVPIVATWTGATIEGAETYKLEVTIAAAQYNGDTPEVSLDSLPNQAIPFRALYNGTDPLVVVEYTSTDTSL